MATAEAGKPAALILAAGASRRLGVPKQLVRIGKETLLRRTVMLCEALPLASVHVVLGAQAARCREALRNTAAICHENRSWQQGMGSSLAFGVRGITDHSTPVAILVMHVDQYRLDQEDLESLLEHWRGRPHRIAAASHSGTAGPPAVFPQQFFSILRGYSDDTGAKHLLSEGGCTRVAIPNAAYDLDTPEDLAILDDFVAQDT